MSSQCEWCSSTCEHSHSRPICAYNQLMKASVSPFNQATSPTGIPIVTFNRHRFCQFVRPLTVTCSFQLVTFSFPFFAACRFYPLGENRRFERVDENLPVGKCKIKIHCSPVPLTVTVAPVCRLFWCHQFATVMNSVANRPSERVQFADRDNFTLNASSLPSNGDWPL